ncbi:SudD [Deinococcus irradiatisoli]|uniref:non-specific serine/threonine protein kinase n=1 Tax=Deinococcus irradiatisoli TaxID=2202254 RepID=A0A2Z3JKJ1_9DEIO|nr:RIO1 family regulatory kinase/ATPase [Deinococcus irradiatisoli]AWN24406.1 SudD [Deinococcus irradiatisoli]
MKGQFLQAEFAESEQKLSRKRRKPQGKRKLADLSAEAPTQDPVLTQLEDLGLVTDVLAEIKSGKEATVYLAQGETGLIGLKIYRDVAARSFKNTGDYGLGLARSSDAVHKAIAKRGSRGAAALQDLWVASEYMVLWTLWQAGLRVPRPLVGPDPFDYVQTSPAVLMAFIGDGEAPAPRLSDVRLSPEEAQQAWQQALEGMARLLKLGLVHGDYSTYNLLWWEGSVTMIDFPQVSDKTNPNFQSLLRRDAESLAQSFRRLGIRQDAESTLREVQRLARTLQDQPRLTLP